ncbi:hypothetical protein ABY44_09490, partial [Burkholderia sp. ZZQ-2]|uniref:hypothetical protein n=1 Tax=Burkholderia sp. ZZQ-2 TaxID=1661766 RepID=UPI003D6F6A9A
IGNGTCNGVRSGIHTDISARAGFRACSRFQSGVDTRRRRIGARRFPTRRCDADAGTGRTCARVRRICPRIGIGALELGTRACRGQSCRLVRPVRRERTGRKLTGHPYRRARP